MTGRKVPYSQQQRERDEFSSRDPWVWVGWVFFVAVVAALLVFLVTSCAHATEAGYPRIGAYVGVRSGGQPLTRSDGSIDSVRCKNLARYPQVAIDLNALLISPNIIPTLVHFRPDIEVAGYHLVTHWHLPDTFVVASWDKTFDAYWHNTIKATGGFEPTWPEGLRVNIGKKATADSLARLSLWGVQRARVRAFFGDYWWTEVKGMNLGNDLSDYVRVANFRAWATLLKGGGFRVYGNGPSADKTGLHGTMIEGFPGTLAPFSKAIAQKSGDWLKSEHTVGTAGDPRLVRFMLATACMTGATVTYGSQVPHGTPWQGDLWFPEYAVDAQGKPDPTGRYVGWLGQPTGDAAKLTNGLYVRVFERGVVLLNPTGSTLTYDFLYPRWKAIGSVVPMRVANVGPLDGLFLWGE